VKWELDNVDRTPIKNVNIREKIPLIPKNSQILEQKNLAKELQKMYQVIEEEQQKTPAYFVRRYVPSSREWQLAKVKMDIQKKGKVQNKEELSEIKRKLAKIYQK